MLILETLEEVASLLAVETKTVFLFTADWCGDCRFLKPYLPEIEATFPEMTFVQLDRDDFTPLAQKWDIFGIPSFVIIENGQEIGRFVDKNRKTKNQIIEFLEGLK
ncbi:thioredoxin [Streptococcus sp. X16XC17]|uniref:thioredoxin family protein n=1 Tax=unclassified Streptococcus TaxID=2608887 RepID=UPI00066FB3C8|nr:MULTISPECIES: thioredoxin family protein [unclassified Streptococcus]TCD45603.1 thioredoxin [Streptococcus sp. X16XC17]